ncbi:hypothetical protein SAMN05421863_103215 [Nitrosomonas communis]|uniref:Uncharacterized protein n=1 Tax=Nitrosomonas communis TaxID=44574 RepID=A0A1I4RDC1_9PROT|nr:hypothetical protein SAMN05421863_103215 [Nitrosomonas communis]
MSEIEPAKLYIPPTCIPHERRHNDEFVIFSITSQQDRELPSHIVGVHAAMCFLSEVGIPRALDPIDINEEPLRYHAEGVTEFTTIFATSVL